MHIFIRDIFVFHLNIDVFMRKKVKSECVVMYGSFVYTYVCVTAFVWRGRREQPNKIQIELIFKTTFDK